MNLGAPGRLLSYPGVPANSRASVNRGDDGQPPEADYDIFSCITRDSVFSSQDGPLLVSTGLGPPIVGRLAGSGTMLGIRDSINTEFQTVPRGSNGASLGGGLYYVWESSYYFASPRRAARLRPRVCVVSANQFQLPVLGDSDGMTLAERITARYSEIDDLRIQLILDQSRNWHYVPFEMGVPMNVHQSPFVGTVQEPFDAHELLTIHFWPEEFGPVGATPGSGGTGGVTLVQDSVTGDWGYFEVFGSYFHYRAATTGFGPPESLIYNEFQDPVADGQPFTDCKARYLSQRKHIMHPPEFTLQGYPFQWIASLAAPDVATFGPAPYSYGANYTGAFQTGMELGRSYVYDADRTGATTDNGDICDAIFEDLHAFFD